MKGMVCLLSKLSEINIHTRLDKKGLSTYSLFMAVSEM